MANASGNGLMNEKIFKDLTSDKHFKGKGRFGDVYGPCVWGTIRCAIKKRMFNTDPTEIGAQKVLGACEKWKSLAHKNLITVYNVSFESPALYIVMECADGGSLRVVLDKCKSDLPPEVLKNWSTQIAEGMAYLHQMDIVHRDLKSPNIVVMENDETSSAFGKTLKITDFDQIRDHDRTKNTSCVGTYAYMAPEVLNEDTFTKPSDVWSCGVVLWEILTRKIPHDGVRDTVIIRQICGNEIKLEIPESCPEIIKQILISCLQYDANERSPFDEIRRVLQNSPADVQLITQWAEKKATSSTFSAIKFKDKTKEENVKETNEKLYEENYTKEPIEESSVQDPNKETIIIDEPNIEKTNGDTNKVASQDEAIERHREWLEQHITPNSRLLGILRANGTLSWRGMVSVKWMYSDCKKNSQLLNYILKKHRSDRLIEALRETEQQHVVDYLIANEDISQMGEEDSERPVESFVEFHFLLPIITDQDMVDRLTINQYFIDRGTSGAIYGPFRWKDKKCALKQILYSPDKLTKERIKEITQPRDRCMKLNHPNLVKVFEVWFPSPALYVLMEYAEGRSLDKILRPKDASSPLEPYPPVIVEDWALQIANGMKYLHENNLIHRNLKAAHVLVMESADAPRKTLKITSFALSKEHDYSVVLALKGTMAWMAPEYIRGECFSKFSDVWSYGVTVWEILTRDVPYKEIRKETDLVRGAFNKTLALKIPYSCPERLQAVLTDCWNYEVNERPSFTKICDHLRTTGVYATVTND